MKPTDLKIELLLLVFAVLPVLSLVLHYVRERDSGGVQVIESAATGPVFVEALLQNEGGERLVSVWIEQGGVKMCRTMTFLARHELRKVVFACPDLAQAPFKVMTQAR